LLKLTINSLAMNRVADIISRKGASAIAVPPDTPIIDALQIMAEKNIGSVLVMHGGEFIGVMTERDYSRKVILKGKNSHDTKVADIMSTDLPPVKPTDTVEHCMQLMTERNIRYLPVFENDMLAGIISMSDVVKQTILAQQETINHLNDYIHYTR
jgi:CBS domain-containing protein